MLKRRGDRLESWLHCRVAWLHRGVLAGKFGVRVVRSSVNYGRPPKLGPGQLGPDETEMVLSSFVGQERF